MQNTAPNDVNKIGSVINGMYLDSIHIISIIKVNNFENKVQEHP